MKNFSLFLFITFCGFYSVTYTSSIVMRGLARAGAATLRQSSIWVGKKAQEDPQATAGAVAGAYVGYRVSEKDSKMLGAVAGAFVGAKLVKDHKTLQTLQTQLNANVVRVAAFETHAATELAVLRARVGQVGQAARQFGRQVKDLKGELERATKRKLVVRRASTPSESAQISPQETGFGAALYAVKSSVQMRLAALKQRAENAAVLAALSV